MLMPVALKGYGAAKMLKEEARDHSLIFARDVHVTPVCREALNNNIEVIVLGEEESTTAEFINVAEKYGLDK
ncbi:MAG: hypothetical protein B6U76_05135 [Desulfurococcales archaeon ex4484_217_2]|nr:MAG: hypothetical protein B6U76_05135 [Desulfurococcales archaeon ex4484_217_2]